MVMLFGRGGCGKTYLMTSVAIGLARGEWFGHAAERGAVLYCAFERPDDTEDRLAALRDCLALRSLPIGLVKLAGHRLDEDCTNTIIAAAKQLFAATDLPMRAIMMDTVAAALGGSREDDEGFGWLRLCGERIHAETGATVFWAHHEGKSDNNGPRGHTTLADACMVW
jgi:RecA-family ATPase